MRRTLHSVGLVGGIVFLGLAQPAFSQYGGGRVYGPYGGGIGIFVPPIGGFGGLNVNIGGGSVDVRVGPSGYGAYGPAFRGLRVHVFEPELLYGPPVVYGPAYNPAVGSGYAATPYLGCVGSDCLPESDGAHVTPRPEAIRPGKEAPPLPPAPELQPAKPSDETTVPQKKIEVNGPELAPLPALPPQVSTDVAPRFFPTSGPSLLPPGVKPRNGFDAGPKPNRPSLPGNDPFGPSRPRDANEPPAA